MKKTIDETWSYTGHNGPEFWHTLCEDFAQSAKSPYQSPIALSRASAQTSPYLKLSFFYQEQVFTTEEFTRAIHFVPAERVSYVIWKDTIFYLTDIHFHVPAEHVIEDQQQDLEFHMVHINAQGETLVVGVFFELVTDGKELFHEQNEPSGQKEVPEYCFNPQIFLPEKLNCFHYTGTLTTPPTNGPVKWFVFEEVRQINRSFITSLWENEKIPVNRRPLQPTHNRSIYYIS